MDTRIETEIEFIPFKMPGFLQMDFGIYIKEIRKQTRTAAISGYCSVIWSGYDSYGGNSNPAAFFESEWLKDIVYPEERLKGILADSSWLEIAVMTGQSKSQAIEAWHKEWGEEKKWQIQSLISGAIGTT